MGVEGEYRARAVLEPCNDVDAIGLVLLLRDFESFGRQEPLQILRGTGFVAGRVLRVDRDEVRQFALHAADVG